MELSRGICVLCLNNTKIVVPPQAEDITNLLCEIIKEFIDINKFQETSNTLKVCPCCLDDIIHVDKQRQNIKEFSTDSEECCLCHDNENLVSVSDWTHFDGLLQNINVKKSRHCSTCVQCIHYLHQVDRIKVNFLKKYPHLMSKHSATSKKEPLRSQKRRLSQNDIPISTIGQWLRNIKPLKYSKWDIKPYKKDAKLTEQIAFVNLVKHDFCNTNIKSHESLDDTDSSQNECSFKSFFKIKLKANKSGIQRVSAGRVRKPKKDISYMSAAKKELLVKIPKVDLKKLESPVNKHAFDSSDSDDYVVANQTTPTKASRKMMPEEIVTGSKTRKSVTFKDDLSEIIKDGDLIENENSDLSTQKSSVKNSKSVVVDPDVAVADPPRNEKNESNDEDSDDELKTKKSYVEEIKQNNDSIFESLKSTPVKKNSNGIENYEGESETTIREKIVSSPISENEYNEVDNAVKETSTDVLNDDDRTNVVADNESVEVANNLTPKSTLLSDSEEDVMVTLKEYKELRLSDGLEKSDIKKSTLDSEQVNGSPKKSILKKRRISLISGETNVYEADEEPEVKKDKVSHESDSHESDNVSDPTILPNKDTQTLSNNPDVDLDNTVSDSQPVTSESAVSEKIVEESSREDFENDAKENEIEVDENVVSTE